MDKRRLKNYKMMPSNGSPSSMEQLPKEVSYHFQVKQVLLLEPFFLLLHSHQNTLENSNMVFQPKNQ